MKSYNEFIALDEGRQAKIRAGRKAARDAQAAERAQAIKNKVDAAYKKVPNPNAKADAKRQRETKRQGTDAFERRMQARAREKAQGGVQKPKFKPAAKPPTSGTKPPASGGSGGSRSAAR